MNAPTVVFGRFRKIHAPETTQEAQALVAMAESVYGVPAGCTPPNWTKVRGPLGQRYDVHLSRCAVFVDGWHVGYLLCALGATDYRFAGEKSVGFDDVRPGVLSGLNNVDTAVAQRFAMEATKWKPQTHIATTSNQRAQACLRSITTQFPFNQ